MVILTLNVGSSSLKFSVWSNDHMIVKGDFQNLGKKGSQQFRFYPEDQEPLVEQLEGLYIPQAIYYLFWNLAKHHIKIEAIGHRVLHGGELLKESCLITDYVKATIKQLYPLGPLHLPFAMIAIEECQKTFPTIPQCAIFDTSFHATLEPKAFLYGVPYELYSKYGIRRYGFHGSSHRYVSKRVCEFLNVDQTDKKVIVVHWGNGISLSAVKNGICLDTSMGMTPLEGPMMGTRSGTIDPAVVSYLVDKLNMTSDQITEMLNKQSGLLGIAGVSDMRDVEARAAAGNRRAQLAIEMICYQIKKQVGAYCAALGGLDVLVFTAGVGENSPLCRAKVMEDFEWLGAKIDPALNNCCGIEQVISTSDSRVSVCIIPTNEEYQIAQDVQQLLS